MVDEIDALKKALQEHFSTGLVIIIGSGLSCSEGIPGMGGLADHLSSTDPSSAGVRIAKNEWDDLVSLIKSDGLEAALHKKHVNEDVAEYIRIEIVKCLREPESKIIKEVLNGARKLKFTYLLPFLPCNTTRLPIITTNYDRLIELSAEISGYCVDTKTYGFYHGPFSTDANKFAFCKEISPIGKHNFRKIEHKCISLFKPHGSFDWTQVLGKPIRTAFCVDAKETLIIAPGQNKYKAGYESPFDMQRELSNGHIDKASKFLIIGYGFNDNHLEVHLRQKINSGTPTLLMTHTVTDKAKSYIRANKNFMALEHDPAGRPGTIAHYNGDIQNLPGEDLWDVESFAKNVLGGK